MMAPMMFDAPGSEKSLMVWTLFASVFTFPLVCWGGIVLAWVAHWTGRSGLGLLLLLLLPSVNFFIGSAVVFWMEYVQNGQLAGP
jgi:p-aminobenzoyl-glutamate transporter AbgT